MNNATLYSANGNLNCYVNANKSSYYMTFAFIENDGSIPWSSGVWYNTPYIDVFTKTIGDGSGSGHMINGYTNDWKTCRYSGVWMDIWYRGKSSSRGTFINTVNSDNANTYPTNGIHSDGYWYTLVQT